MNKGWIKTLIIISLFFVTIGLEAGDFSIVRDVEYFNPLASPFKWDIKLEKKLASSQSIQVEYQLYNTEKQTIIWEQKKIIKSKDNSFSVYLLITKITNKTSGPSIIVATIPNQGITRFEAAECRYSNAVLFTGKHNITSNFTVSQKLLSASLLKSNQYKAQEGFFFFMHVPADKEKAVCNLTIDFSIKIILIDARDK